uniref:Uncharacterized protein n=1 Tax=Anopheles atroparvus TaxID=41427 RepID=A0AAG5CWT3_ANOAO
MMHSVSLPPALFPAGLSRVFAPSGYAALHRRLLQARSEHGTSLPKGCSCRRTSGSASSASTGASSTADGVCNNRPRTLRVHRLGRHHCRNIGDPQNAVPFDSCAANSRTV